MEFNTKMKFLLTHINILEYYFNKEYNRKNITKVKKDALEEMIELLDKIKNICISHIN